MSVVSLKKLFADYGIGEILVLLVLAVQQKNKIWGYHWAMVGFTLFAVYQVYRYFHTFSPMLLILTLFDIFIVLIIWLEYRRHIKRI